MVSGREGLFPENDAWLKPGTRREHLRATIIKRRLQGLFLKGHESWRPTAALSPASSRQASRDPIHTRIPRTVARRSYPPLLLMFTLLLDVALVPTSLQNTITLL